MKYFIDTKFVEGKQDKTFLGFKYGETKLTIDLIGIGIVSEEININCNCNAASCEQEFKNNKLVYCDVCGKKANSNEYYAISKDFDLKSAWNNECVRENVLKPIMQDLCYKYTEEVRTWFSGKFTINECRKLINKYGKTNKQIAQEIIEFTQAMPVNYLGAVHTEKQLNDLKENINTNNTIEFYGYNCSYDWIVLNQLFGTMMDLPSEFPYYCNDLKQMLDDKIQSNYLDYYDSKYDREHTFAEKLNFVQHLKEYPKQTNEHNALADAKWNYELYKFLQFI